MSRDARKPGSSVFPTRSDINRCVQSQKKVRSLKFRIKEEEKLYYPSGENKGADLRLCFRIGKIPVFSQCGSINLHVVYQITCFMFQGTSCYSFWISKPTVSTVRKQAWLKRGKVIDAHGFSQLYSYHFRFTFISNCDIFLIVTFHVFQRHSTE